MSSRKARLLNPPNVLKQKVGSGGLPDKIIETGQRLISENKVDFTPYAENFLESVRGILKEFSEGKVSDSEAIKKLSLPIMQLKANGGMFNYILVSRIADILLLLLDNISELNADAMKIINAHQNTLQIIIAGKLRGSGGREGALLEQELYSACQRFYAKYDIEPV